MILQDRSNVIVSLLLLKVLSAIKDVPEEKGDQKVESSKKDKKSHKKVSLQEFLSATPSKNGVGLDEILAAEEPQVVS